MMLVIECTRTGGIYHLACVAIKLQGLGAIVPRGLISPNSTTFFALLHCTTSVICSQIAYVDNNVRVRDCTLT
jgi:hypothetical protein